MKKQFRIRLFNHAKHAAEMVAIMAAKVNSGESHATLKDLKLVGEGLVETFPALNPQTTFTLTDGLTLCIDVKIEGNFEPAAIIEEIEIFELNEIENN